MSNPSALTSARPPSRARTERAIFFAIATSLVARYALNAISTGRAPTATIPPVGWTAGSPTSGARAGSVPIGSRIPSNPPFRTTARSDRSGLRAASA